MYRDGKVLFSHPAHNFVLNHAALGDMITSLPAIAFARERYQGPELKMRVWLPVWHHELVAHLLAPYGEFELRDLQTFPAKWDERKNAGLGPVSYNAALEDTHTRCRVHMVDYAFNFLVNARPESMLERSYVTRAPLGPQMLNEPYVVFPVGATSDNKLFHASVMGPIMRWCIENRYKPVIVGTKTSHTHTKVEGRLTPIVLRDQAALLPKEIVDQCLDLREQTTLLQLRDLLGHAEAVVGVDGGTLHLAGTTDTNIVFASGTTLPKHRYLARHGDPSYKIRYVGPRDLACAGCQSNWPLTVFHFTKCAYGDNACMSQMHPEDFINGLKDLGL